MELHDLSFGKIIRGEYQIDWQEHVATFQGKRPTRSTDHENLQDNFYNPVTILSVSKESFSTVSYNCIRSLARKSAFIRAI